MNVPEEQVAALIEAVITALRESAAVESAVCDSVPSAELSAVLPVKTAAGGGALALALPEATALALARRILADTGVEPDAAAVRDCAGELINVICGQAKTLLRGTPYHFTLSTPRVADGAPDVRDPQVIAFASDAGPFALHVHLPT